MITKTIIELHKIFNEFNKSFFNDKLPETIILIEGKKKGAPGTFWADSWKNEKDNKKHEITINPDYLNRGIEETCGTMLHEMVHLYCEINNIKDTSNNAVYHNKKFKEEAESRGLIITKAKTIGWSVTELKPETKELIKKFKIDDSAFEYYRKVFEEPKKKTIIHKYQCPKCEKKISHYKEINLICGDCNTPFEKKDT